MKLSTNPLTLLAATLAAASPFQTTLTPLTSSLAGAGLDATDRSESSLLSLHRNLVQIESITYDEHAVGVWLSWYLQGRGLTVREQRVRNSPERRPRLNLHAYPAGSHGRTRVLLTSHIDTVPPFLPYRRAANASGDFIWGRGSNDAKGSVAAQVTAWAELRDEGDLEDGDVGLLFVVGEETGGDGMKDADEGLEHSWEAVVFGEPTEGKLVSGHKGLLGFEIEVQGVPAHSGYPWLGTSANSLLMHVLRTLEKTPLPSSDKYGNSTLNVGQIEGGVAMNVIPEKATARCAVRIAAGEPGDIKKLYNKVVQDAFEDFFEGGDSGDASVKINYLSEDYPPIDLDHDIDGMDVITVNYGTDVPHLNGDHKKYLYGPGSILVAHSDHEYVTVKDLEQAVVDYKKIVRELLSRKSQ